MSVVVDLNGNKEWWVDGNLHRVDGPAVEWANGSKWWYINGKLHRVDGPAVEWADGNKWWYFNGEKLSEIQHGKYIQLINKRERRIQLKVWLKWTDWVMDPGTERGQKFMERQYQKMVEIN